MKLELRILAVLVLAALLSPRAWGQSQQQQSAADLEEKDNNTGIYVRDSVVALDRLALAQRMEGIKEWAKSADVYQEILEKYSDRVLPENAPAGDPDVRYTSVTETVRNALSKWPPEGLDVYRGLYESKAAKMMGGDAANDPQMLHQVFSLYFPTESAKIAGIRLMDMDFEAGDYNAVMQVGQRLLRWHPNLVAERPMVLYRTALAEKLCGFNDQAKDLLNELTTKYAQTKGAVGGSDVVLADALKQELATETHIVVAGADDSWETLGGDESRGKISSSKVRPVARMYSIPLQKASWKWVPDETLRQNMEKNYTAEASAGANLGVLPAVDRGQLFFQDNACIYGVSLDSGAPIPGWLQTYPQGGVYHLPGTTMAMPTGRQFAVTVSDKALAAVMYRPQAGNIPQNAIRGPAGMVPVPGLEINFALPMPGELVCLDRETGKELWRTSPQKLPESQANLRGVDIGGPAVIVGDSVYVGATSSHGGQFEDAYVLCFDLRDGSFRWATYIASTASSDMAFVDGMPVPMYVYPRISYASGQIFVGTKVGAVAALDAYTGSITWLNIYRQNTEVSNNFGPWGRRGGFMIAGGGMIIGGPGGAPEIPAPEPWTLNPIVVQNGKLFLLPPDSNDFLIYDAATGNSIKRVPLTSFSSAGGFSQPSRPDTLLGVVHNKLFVADKTYVYCMDWTKYDPDVGRAPKESWTSAGGDAKTNTRGRGFVTADAVYRPTARALDRVLLANAEKEAEYPVNGWDGKDDGPGNVIATSNLMIVAGANQVAVYSDLDSARKRLDAEVAANPSDPLPELHYAEVMFAAWQLDESQKYLVKAFDLLGGSGHLHDGPARDRAFDDALQFANRLVARVGQSTEMIQSLYGMASDAAQNPAEQVAVRLSHARFDAACNDFATAIDLYQQILLDNSMRLVEAPDTETQSSSQAALVAAKQISVLLGKKAGKQHYEEKYDATARQAMGLAMMAGDAQQLLEIAKSYPNSPVVDDCDRSAANVFEAHGDFAMAAQVLRQLLSRPKQDEQQLLEALARDYLKMGRIEVAASRMQQAAQFNPVAKLSKPMTLPDGSTLQNVNIKEAADALSNYHNPTAQDSPPDFHLPTKDQITAWRAKETGEAHPTLPPSTQPESPDTVIANASGLIVPPENFSRNDRLITWSPTGLGVYPVGKSQPIFVCSQISTQAIGAAWVPDGLLVWTARSTALLNSDNGQVKWNVAITDLAPADATASNQDVSSFAIGASAVLNTSATVDIGNEQITNVQPCRDRYTFITSAGRVFSLNPSDGKLAWETGVGEFKIDRVAVGDDFTVLRLSQAQQFVLMVIDSFSGNMIGRRTFDGNNNGDVPLNFALGADGSLVYSLKDRLCLLDLYDANLGEGSMDPKMTSAPAQGGGAPFDGMTNANQILIHGDTVIALENGGKFLGFYSEKNLVPWDFGPHTFNPINLPDRVGPTDSLHISGKYAFVQDQRDLYPVYLPHPPTDKPPKDTGASVPHLEQFLYGKDCYLTVNRPYPPGGARGEQVEIRAYTRAPSRAGSDEESGRQLVNPILLSNVAPDATWQAFEGGFAYFSHGEVHMILGTRDQLPN